MDTDAATIATEVRKVRHLIVAILGAVLGVVLILGVALPAAKNARAHNQLEAQCAQLRDTRSYGAIGAGGDELSREINGYRSAQLRICGRNGF